MPRGILLAPAALAAVLALAPAAHGAEPSAKVAGVDAPPPLPSIVQTRLTRLEGAVERLTEDVNEGDAVHATKAGKVVRRQLAAAWRGARYYITHPPAPPAEDARAQARSRAGFVRVRDLSRPARRKLMQDDEAPVIADPVATAVGVFDAFHDVSSTVIELTDGARGPVLDAMSRTMFLTLDRRDRAVNDVHLLAPPVPPEDLMGVARAAQDDEALTFDLAMPGLVPWLDDELQHVDGLLTDAPDLRPGGRRILTKARDQVTATKAAINTFWPPEVED